MRRIFDTGDRVLWPQTQIPASEDTTGRTLEVECRSIVLHRSGNPYIRYLYKDLNERIVEDMYANVEEDFDNIIVIDGPEGTGKSHDACFIAKMFDPEFDILKSLVDDWTQFFKSITEDPQKVYWFDEAALFADSRDWNKDENKQGMKALKIIRSMHLTIIMCLPSFDNIDVYLRTFRTRYLIHAHRMKWGDDREAKRGYHEILVPKTKEERRSLPKDAHAEDYFRSVGFARFPPMSPEDKAKYDERKAKGQKNALKDMLEKINPDTSKYRRDKQSLTRLVSYLADSEGLSYQEIAEIAGMPYNTVKGMAWRARNEQEGTE